VNRRRRWLVNVLLLVAATVVALTAVEVGLRLFYPFPTGVWHQDREGLALHWPGLVTQVGPFGVTASFNSAGMRDREHPTHKRPGVFRIMVLGDSFMEALQVPFEESFPSLLERELGERSPGHVEVMNVSVSGWGTDDELRYLNRYGRRFRPDLIVVAMTLHNDVSDNLRERFHTIRDGALVERPPTQASFLDYKIIELKGLLASRFQVYQLITRARRAREMRVEAESLSRHVNGLFMPADARISRGLELTRLLLEQIRALAAEEGGRVVLVLIPLGVQVSDREFTAFAGGTPGAQLERPQRELKRIADRVGVDAIDLLSGFQEWTASGGADLYLSRDGHWDRPGHRLAARLVGSELSRRGLAPR
jgi:GDSL-like Lipase/Acylhydrolase family